VTTALAIRFGETLEFVGVERASLTGNTVRPRFDLLLHPGSDFARVELRYVCSRGVNHLIDDLAGLIELAM
jgi:hypothetical protein